MTHAPTVLVVDDDRAIRELLAEYFEKNGLRTRTAADGRSTRAILAQEHVDLVVLDLMLPDEEGLSICRDLRATSTVPVIMLTARGDKLDRIIGLEMGADDYVPKPFEPRELLARIRSVLRRTHATPVAAEAGPARRYRFAGWTLDVQARHLVSADDVVVLLSSAEYRLLTAFLDHPNHVLSRDRLLDLTVGRSADPLDRSIDLQVSRLRQKLGEDARMPVIIKTVRNEGYVLAAAVTVEG